MLKRHARGSGRTGTALLAGLLLLVLPLVGMAQESGSVAEGARVYGDVCGNCHNARSPLERSDRDWVTIVNHMRVRGNMTGKQARDVLAFLQATNNDPAQSVAPPQEPAVPAGETEGLDAAQRGGELVAAKACLGCHVIGDAGGNIGTSLNGVVGRKGEDYVRQKVADPTFDNTSSMMPNFGLSEEQVGWIAAYLATLNGKS